MRTFHREISAGAEERDEQDQVQRPNQIVYQLNGREIQPKKGVAASVQSKVVEPSTGMTLSVPPKQSPAPVFPVKYRGAEI